MPASKQAIFCERRIDFGPGYRVYYFGRNGGKLITLLVGGTKKRQWRDIDKAKTYWTDYKRRKKEACYPLDAYTH